MSALQTILAAPIPPGVEGVDFVVCTECGSEIDISDSEGYGWRDVDEPTWMELRCDWWPCGETFDALVLPQNEAPGDPGWQSRPGA